jgi:hypothetical protein
VYNCVQRQLISITVGGGANIAGSRVAAAVAVVADVAAAVTADVVVAAVVAAVAAAVTADVAAARIAVSKSLLTFSCTKTLFRVQ